MATAVYAETLDNLQQSRPTLLIPESRNLNRENLRTRNLLLAHQLKSGEEYCSSELSIKFRVFSVSRSDVLFQSDWILSERL
jgi:hypothetical protein